MKCPKLRKSILIRFPWQHAPRIIFYSSCILQSIFFLVSDNKFHIVFLSRYSLHPQTHFYFPKKAIAGVFFDSVVFRSSGSLFCSSYGIWLPFLALNFKLHYFSFSLTMHKIPAIPWQRENVPWNPILLLQKCYMPVDSGWMCHIAGVKSFRSLPPHLVYFAHYNNCRKWVTFFWMKSSSVWIPRHQMKAMLRVQFMCIASN